MMGLAIAGCGLLTGSPHCPDKGGEVARQGLKPPYYAVIFTSLLRGVDSEGYSTAAMEMEDLVLSLTTTRVPRDG